MEYTWESMLESKREFLSARLNAAFCGCDGEKPCGSCDLPVVKTMAGLVICDYHGESLMIRTLATRLQKDVRGQGCLPETMEYAYASNVVTVGRQLGSVSREALEVYTGYDEAGLMRLREESSEAIDEAQVSLYGHPFDY